MANKVSAPDVLDNMAQYLEYLLDEGTTHLAVSSDTKQALGSLSTPRPRGSARKTSGPRSSDAESGLSTIAKTVSGCTQCSLHETRTQTVPGQGAIGPEIMFVGEAPGFEEDRQGFAFVGRAGQLLTKMIEAMGYTREEVFIGNILKCRPPNNRAPLPDEMETCLPYLKQQIALLKPKVIICLGATAVKGLLGVKIGITKLRGTWHSFEGTDVMPTYHPAYLLRNPPAKKDVWEDLKAVLKHLGRPVPKVKRPRRE